MSGEWIVEAIKQEIKSRIPENWTDYHSPLCSSVACDDDCPSTNYRLYGIWRLWSYWKESHERQRQIQRQQAEIHQLVARYVSR